MQQKALLNHSFIGIRGILGARASCLQPLNISQFLSNVPFINDMQAGRLRSQDIQNNCFPGLKKVFKFGGRPPIYGRT